MTQAALLTALGQGGIATVQLVGRQALPIARRVFRPARGGPASLQRLGPDVVVYGHICDQDQIIDDGLLTARRLPDGRDVVEVHLHGGVRVVQRLMMALQRHGAAFAQADLQAAEVHAAGRGIVEQDAIMALAAAKTRLAACWIARQRQLLPARLGELLETLTGQAQDLEQIGRELRSLLAHYPAARLLIDGATVALLGPPNAGKSTLANRLLGRQRSIVSHQPGTTRDWVADVAAIDGFPFELLDTAGLAGQDDPIGRQAAERAGEQALRADLRLLVLDATQRLDRQVMAVAEQLTAQGPTVTVLNKIDLLSQPNQPDSARQLPQPVVKVSALDGRGLAELSRAMIRLLGLHQLRRDVPTAFTARQAEGLRSVLVDWPARCGQAVEFLRQLLGPTDR